MFGGAEGSLKCLVEGRGEVAFTTIDTAVMYFDRRPEERDHYELLCLDGSRMAISSRGCDWAKHPTNTFVIRKGRGKKKLLRPSLRLNSILLERNKEIYLRLLQQIFIRYGKLRPSWFDKSFVSSTNVTQLVSMPFTQAKWSKYLGNYHLAIKDYFLLISLIINCRILHSIN